MSIKFVFSLLVILIMFLGVVNSLSITFNLNFSNNDTSQINENLLEANSVLMQVNTDRECACKYSMNKRVSYDSMEGNFDITYGMMHKKALTDLIDGVYRHYIKCKDSSGNISGELEAIFKVNVPVSAEIILENQTMLKAGRVEIKLITSKVVGQTPSLSYSFDNIDYKPIALFGSERVWRGYIIIPTDIGEKVGSFKFQARDLEGKIGTEIRSGSVFLVDTIEPAEIYDVRAESEGDHIRVSWYYDENIKEFKIYKSTTPNPTYSDFLRTTQSTTFVDNNVEKGKTYYYKVSAVDSAGNEGRLSRDVFATVINASSVVSPSGLETRFYSFVDNAVFEINKVSENIDVIIKRFDERSDEVGVMYRDLKLKSELDSIKNEIGILKNEVEEYKNLPLTKEELDKKLDSARLKLGVIKKRIPEEIIIISKNEFDKEIKNEDVDSLIAELRPDLGEKNAERTAKKSLDAIKNSNLAIKTRGYNFEIVFFDGARKELSMIIEEIESTLTKENNVSIVEIVPKDLEINAANIAIKNNDYNVLKADPIFSFDANIKRIVYTFDKHIDLSSIRNIKTIVLYRFIEDKEKASFLSGYAFYVNFEQNKDYIGIILGIILLTCLFMYFLFVKRKSRMSERVSKIKKEIEKMREEVKENKIDEAKKRYLGLREEYKRLEKKEKMRVYKKIEEISKLLGGLK